MRICEIKGLVDRYGANTTLGKILTEIQGNKVHKCPKCNGLGYTEHEYNSYPEGFPDSGWVYQPAYKSVECDLCKGEGYTEHEYKPKMIQCGWE